MERLRTIEEYSYLVNTIKGKIKRPFSNNYFMPQEIQRYIQLERAYYTKTDAGIIFIFDEEAYYRVCLYLDANKTFDIPSLDKKTLVRNVYRKDKKEDEMSLIENRLEEIKFKKVGVTVQLRGEIKEIFNRYKRFERFVNNMQKKGYQCHVAKGEYIDKVEELLKKENIIKDYHMDYMCPEEKGGGTYLYLTDAKGTMCAASGVMIKGNNAHGIGIAIDARYKLQGLAPVLGYHRMKKMSEAGINNIQGWALIDNEESLRYHTSSGYKVMNKYAEDWIREKIRR